MALRSRKFFWILGAVALVNINLFAAGKSAMPFLKMMPGARAQALGQAYVGLAEGPETLASNPAGLGQTKARELSLQHVFYVEGIFYDNLFYIHPAKLGAWAIQTGFLGVKGLTRTQADPTSPDGFKEVGDFSTNNFQAVFSYGRPVGSRWQAGTSLKILRESLSDTSAVGFGLDLGVLYQSKELPLQFGASLQNLGPKIKYQSESYDLPRSLRAGFSVHREKTSPYPWIPEQSLASVEASRILDGGDESLSGGIEVPVFSQSLALRSGYHYTLKKQNLGYQMSVPNGFSLGFGLSLTGWSLDYSASSLGNLGLAHHINITLKLKS